MATGNKYAGKCYLCGGHVPANTGVLYRNVGGLRYAVAHVPKSWHGSPVSGNWVGGCPDRDGSGADRG